MGTGFVVAMSVVMMVVGGAFLYMLNGRKNAGPKGAVEWIGTVLSGLLVVTSLALLLMASDTNAPTPVAQEQPKVIEDFTMNTPAGDFTFVGVHDQAPHRLSEYRGKVVLINFWATWCGPCRTEIPDLNRLQDDYGDDGLVIVSISDESRDLLLEFENYIPMRTARMRMAALTELPTPFARSFEVRPVTFIVDREGHVRRYLLGMRSYDFFERAISPFL
jgi:cytochrome c-type biogenesis protein